MPAYQVALVDSAKADARHIYDWILERTPFYGPTWFESLIDKLYSLESQPLRCPLAREASALNRPIRCLLFGKKHGIYRILYEVDESSRTVWVLHIRHGSLPELSVAANLPTRD